MGAVQGTAPPPREGSAWAFDPKTAKVLHHVQILRHTDNDEQISLHTKEKDVVTFFGLFFWIKQCMY